MTDYRAVFDAELTFLNGGGLRTEGFRLDIPAARISDAELGALFVKHLGLLMVDQVNLSNVDIVEEPHRGSRGVPTEASGRRLVELNHVISAGMTTFPGLPGPEIAEHLSFEESRRNYAAGTEFAIHRMSMVGNTGTYVDSPYHRYPDGADLENLPLSSVADLPAVVVRLEGVHEIEPAALATLDVAGAAILLHTGWDRHWGTETYLHNGPHLTAAGAQFLADQGAALVGIDSVNIDSTAGKERPAHSILLAAGIPVLEHLNGLDQVPVSGARLHAAPPRIRGFGTFTVRAYAVISR